MSPPRLFDAGDSVTVNGTVVFDAAPWPGMLQIDQTIGDPTRVVIELYLPDRTRVVVGRLRDGSIGEPASEGAVE